VYLLVLGAGMLVIVTGVSAILLARTQGDAGRLALEKRAARQAALDGLALGVQAAPCDVAGRVALSTRPELVQTRIGSSDVSVLASDPEDGDIQDDVADPIRLTATGSCVSALQSVSVDLSPVYVAAPAAGFTLAVGGTVTLTSASVDLLGQGYSGSHLTVGGSSVSVTGWTTGSTVIGSIDGPVTISTEKINLPDTATLDWLVNMATPIPYASTGGVIESTLLSPSSNPYGGTNPRGIYMISCGGLNLVIRDCRFYGTLVVLQPGASSRLEGAVVMNPTSAELPVLLVSGDFRSILSGHDLSEVSLRRNLNPPSVPYQGQSDLDKLDTYASVLAGTVIITGDFTSTGNIAVDGALLVGGNLSLRNQNWFRYSPVQGVTPGLSLLSHWKMDRTTFRRTAK
jgi:hypothetical protein